jgi:outer membrane lipoprotein-sorting protein
MWINHQDWNAVQVQLFEATRDSIMVKYKDVKRNHSISNSIFRLDLPRDVKKAG